MTKMLVDLKVGESLSIGVTTVRLERKSGQLARLVIESEQDIPITLPKDRRKPDSRMSAAQDSGARNHG